MRPALWDSLAASGGTPGSALLIVLLTREDGRAKARDSAMQATLTRPAEPSCHPIYRAICSDSRPGTRLAGVWVSSFSRLSLSRQLLTPDDSRPPFVSRGTAPKTVDSWMNVGSRSSPRLAPSGCGSLCAPVNGKSRCIFPVDRLSSYFSVLLESQSLT